jgi:hypothetical protein
MTGLRFARADVPLLDRVLTALRGGTEAFAVPEGYLTGGDGGWLRRRPEWQFEQPPEVFTVALAQLRRLTVTCPGAEVRQHTEVPWQWTATVPGACDDDKPLSVTGQNLGELAAAMEAAVEWRARTRITLDELRSSWGDRDASCYNFVYPLSAGRAVVCVPVPGGGWITGVPSLCGWWCRWDCPRRPSGYRGRLMPGNRHVRAAIMGNRPGAARRGMRVTPGHGAAAPGPPGPRHAQAKTDVPQLHHLVRRRALAGPPPRRPRCADVRTGTGCHVQAGH